MVMVGGGSRPRTLPNGGRRSSGRGFRPWVTLRGPPSWPRAAGRWPPAESIDPARPCLKYGTAVGPAEWAAEGEAPGFTEVPEGVVRVGLIVSGVLSRRGHGRAGCGCGRDEVGGGEEEDQGERVVDSASECGAAGEGEAGDTGEGRHHLGADGCWCVALTKRDGAGVRRPLEKAGQADQCDADRECWRERPEQG